ncbi:MAG: FdhF/YdeP family oxidoreductase [Candidatus Hydrogenedentes bacterium]|nr:FdhF/YdeP family oxidoreductase [Candidatus Hydrogenedentota bacterium]
MSEVCSARRVPKAGGGWPAIRYVWRKARMAGGLIRLYRALRSKNACKTCALGMGGQRGGMVNEQGRFPEVCKKSVQAMTADMQGRVREGFFEAFSLHDLQVLTSRELEASGRLVEPLYAGPGDPHYRAISWEDALDKIAGKLRRIRPDESFFYFSGRSSNEAGFLLQLFARLYGTNNVNNCSYYCHQASGVGLSSIYGSGTSSIVLDDIEHCDLLFLIGGNPASNHPRMISAILRMKKRAGKVVVVNPVREVGLVNFRIPSNLWSLLFGTRIADVYVQPHIGGDIAFLAGIGKAILERDAIDRDFIASHTEGWEAFKELLGNLTWEEVVNQSGVTRETMEQVADLCARSKGTVFAWTMGITHHAHGVQNVQMIGNIALMRGMLGRPHAGLLPIRGHSNVQGIGSMGVTPKLKAEVFKRLEEKYKISLPAAPGLDTLASVHSAAEGNIRLAFCVGGNLYGSNPDARFVASALGKIDLVVYLSTTLNTGHARGLGRETLILPVLARDEEAQATTQESMFNYVRMSDGGPRRYAGPRSEVEVVAGIAQRVFPDGSPIDWKALQTHRNIRAAIAEIVPGYEAVGTIDNTQKEFQIAGRTFHQPKFATPSGRATFHPVALPRLKGAQNGGMCLMTLRSEGQFNTVVYEDEDIYRGQERRDVIMMHPSDISRLGLQINQPVTVRTAVGEMRNILVRELDIRPGNCAMYYPEANVLVPRDFDPASKTPAFKNVEVQIVRL